MQQRLWIPSLPSVKLLIGKDDTGTEEMSESIIEEPDETTFKDSLLIPVE